MGNITTSVATASEAITTGMVAILTNFQGFSLIDFYGDTVRDPMTANQFYGVLGLLTVLEDNMKKHQKKLKR